MGPVRLGGDLLMMRMLRPLKFVGELIPDTASMSIKYMNKNMNRSPIHNDNDNHKIITQYEYEYMNNIEL